MKREEVFLWKNLLLILALLLLLPVPFYTDHDYAALLIIAAIYCIAIHFRNGVKDRERKYLEEQNKKVELA